MYIFQNLDGFNSNIPGGQSKGFDFPNENSGMDIGTTEYANSNYRTGYIIYNISYITRNIPIFTLCVDGNTSRLIKLCFLFKVYV